MPTPEPKIIEKPDIKPPTNQPTSFVSDPLVFPEFHVKPGKRPEATTNSEIIFWQIVDIIYIRIYESSQSDKQIETSEDISSQLK